MDTMPRDRLPPGVQPYDPLNGFRVGALAGALLGAIPTFVVGSPWFVIGGSILGGIGGYLRERRRLLRSIERDVSN